MAASPLDNPCQTMRVFLGAELHGVNSFYGHCLATTHHTKANLNIYHRSPPPPKTQYFIVKWGFPLFKSTLFEANAKQFIPLKCFIGIGCERERDGKTRMAKYSHFQVYCCCNSCIFILLPLEVVDFNYFQHVTCQSHYVS